MNNTINNIAAKMSGQGNNEVTCKDNEFVTETELTDILYKMDIEEEEDSDDPEYYKQLYNNICDTQTKEIHPILNKAFADKYFLEYKDYILNEVCTECVYGNTITQEQVQELVDKLRDELVKRHIFDKHYFVLQKKYNSNSKKTITDYSRFGNYSIDNITEIFNIPFAFFCEDMNIPSDVRYTISSAIEESILRNKHGFTDVPIGTINDTIKKAKEYACDDILSIFFELDTTLESIIEYADIRLLH